MADNVATFMWTMRALYAGLCLVIVYLHLLPLDTVPRGWAGPDIVLALTFAWVLRRPEYVPPLLIAMVLLLCDLLFHRPPGLWAALVLIASQTLRGQTRELRDMTFSVEWFSVATTLVAITIAYRVTLAILLIDQAPLGLSLMQMVMTLVAYPLVVIVSQALFGVRRLAPGDVDPMGGRT